MKGLIDMYYLENYQTFTHKSELNEAIALHLEAYGQMLNQTERMILTFLSRYAVKYPGVAHLKNTTIAQAMKKSERTVRRALAKLESLQIIERRIFHREKTGGFGANLYIFLPYQAVNKSVEETVSKQIPTNPIETSGFEEEPVTFHTRFSALISGYIGHGNEKLIRELYGVHKAKSIPLMKFSIYEDHGEVFETFAIQAINILFQTTKKRQIRNLVGYYDGILGNVIYDNLLADAFFYEETE